MIDNEINLFMNSIKVNNNSKNNQTTSECQQMINKEKRVNSELFKIKKKNTRIEKNSKLFSEARLRFKNNTPNIKNINQELFVSGNIAQTNNNLFVNKLKNNEEESKVFTLTKINKSISTVKKVSNKISISKNNDESNLNNIRVNNTKNIISSKENKPTNKISNITFKNVDNHIINKINNINNIEKEKSINNKNNSNNMIKKINNNVKINTKFTNNTENKNILIYQNKDMHTEVIGTLIYNFMKYNIHIYYKHTESKSNSIPYYEQIFKKKIINVNEINESIYDAIIILTSGELNQLTPKNKIKYILINHENGTVNDNYYNISLTPIVKSHTYILPIYMHNNNNNRNNQISIIGSLLEHQRDMKNISRLIKNFPKYVICIYTRYIDPEFKNSLSDYKNYVLYEKMDTKTMINKIRNSKFIYTADTDNYSEKGVRGGILTGMVPIGLNNNIPIIMTKKLNTIYNLKGVLEYDENILELKDTIENMNNTTYASLLEKSKKDAERICTENKIKFEIIQDKFNSY